MQIVTTARHGGAQLRHPAETRCCATTSRSHVEKRSDSRRFGSLALHRATFLTSQHVSEAGPSRVQAPVGEAGRVPDAAKRPRSRTRQAFPQTQQANRLEGTVRRRLRMRRRRLRGPRSRGRRSCAGARRAALLACRSLEQQSTTRRAGRGRGEAPVRRACARLTPFLGRRAALRRACHARSVRADRRSVKGYTGCRGPRGLANQPE